MFYWRTDIQQEYLLRIFCLETSCLVYYEISVRLKNKATLRDIPSAKKLDIIGRKNKINLSVRPKDKGMSETSEIL